MRTSRDRIDVEDLLKIILLLILTRPVLEIIGEVFGLFGALLGPFQPPLGLVVTVLIVLWLLDRIRRSRDDDTSLCFSRETWVCVV